MDNSLENIIELGKKFLEQKGIINPRSEALLIVQNALNKSKLEILTNSKEKIPVEKKTIIKNKFFERSTGKPVSKIFGKKEFYSNNFFVNSNVLDPRPESELLVDVSKEILVRKKIKPDILELGVGSGCIIISILLDLIELQIRGVGIDISNDALEIANINRRRFNIRNLKLFQSDWFSNVQNKYDLIISNPPYVKKYEINFLKDEVKKFDPLIALDGGKYGLDSYKKIATKAKNFFKKDGMICLEIGLGQKESVDKIFNEFGYKKILEEKDLQDIHRVVVYKLK